jgi:hypothetical protein
MNGTIAFTTAEDGSKENATCYLSGDNKCYPSAETFTWAEPDLACPGEHLHLALEPPLEPVPLEF